MAKYAIYTINNDTDIIFKEPDNLIISMRKYKRKFNACLIVSSALIALSLLMLFFYPNQQISSPAAVILALSLPAFFLFTLLSSQHASEGMKKMYIMQQLQKFLDHGKLLQITYDLENKTATFEYEEDGLVKEDVFNVDIVEKSSVIERDTLHIGEKITVTLKYQKRE